MLGAAFPFVPVPGAAGGGGPPAPRLTWPNGYRYRWRNVITAAIHQMPNGGEGWVKYRLTSTALRSVASGGHVVNNAAWPDIRFETGSGSLLEYDLESWSASTGALVVYVHLTNFVADANYTVLLNYGKASITANEANPTGCWAGYAQAVDMSTGIDRSGNNRHFTLTNVTATTLFGSHAGDFGFGDAPLPSSPPWPNGFSGQIEVRLEAVTSGGSVSNALYPLIVTNPALATAAQIDDGGNVLDEGYGGLSRNNGLDVQLEMGGTVLGYVRVGYAADTGFWAGLVNIPTRNFAIDESIMLYVGKDATDGQNASLARTGGWLGWWAGSGADLTGQGRNLIEHGGVTINDTLDGLPAIRFDGSDDYLDQASSTYLNGLPAISAIQVYEPEFQNELRELWNISVGTAGELGFRFKQFIASPETTRRLVAIAKYGASVLELQSANNTAPGITGGSAPVNTLLPEIDVNSGVIVGTVLTCSAGTWQNFPNSYTYQWLRGATAVGTDSESYTVVAGDSGALISCRVTATNTAGSAQATSVAVGPVGTAAVPALVTAPAVTPAAGVQIGTTLTTTNGTWTNAPTSYARQWQADGVAISPAQTGTSYTPVAGDLGKAIRCRVTASNATGASTPANSNATNAVLAADASPFVHVYPSPFSDTSGKTIKRPGVGGVAAFNVNTGNTFRPASNEIWDLRGMTATVHENSNSASSFTCSGAPASAVICGGKSTSSNEDYFGTTAGKAWKDIHGTTTTGAGASGNYGSLYFVGPCAAGFRAHGFYCKRNMDGIIPKDNTQGAVIENSVFTEIRDDVTQDDAQNDMTFRGCYLQGHVIFSWRPGAAKGGPVPPKSGRIMTVENCLIHLDRMMYLGEDTVGDSGSKRADKYVSPTNRNNTIRHPEAGMGSKWLHKTQQTNDAGGLKIRYKMKNVLIRIDTPSVDGINEGEAFPGLADGVGAGSNNGSSYENVHVVWLGPNYNTTGGPVAWDTVFANTGQTKASLATMGITIHDGGAGGTAEQDAFDYWMTHYNAFMTAHDYNSGTDTFKHQRTSYP